MQVNDELGKVPSYPELRTPTCGIYINSPGALVSATEMVTLAKLLPVALLAAYRQSDIPAVIDAFQGRLSHLPCDGMHAWPNRRPHLWLFALLGCGPWHFPPVDVGAVCAELLVWQVARDAPLVNQSGLDSIRARCIRCGCPLFRVCHVDGAVPGACCCARFHALRRAAHDSANRF